nr:InfA [Trichosanthes pilosa]
MVTGTTILDSWPPVLTESLPAGMFGVCLDNEDPILGYVSGRIRHRFIHILGHIESKLQ